MISFGSVSRQVTAVLNEQSALIAAAKEPRLSELFGASAFPQEVRICKMTQEETVKSLTARWKADGYYAPKAPPAAEAVRAFEDWYRHRLGSAPPSAFMEFLALADGGQYDAYYLFSIADIMDTTDEAFPFIVIGDSGNVDRFILRPDGSCAMVNLSDYEHVSEDFPDFDQFLARLLRES